MGHFTKNITFVVLYLKDYGWPVEWPSGPNKRLFLIADPSWQFDDGSVTRIDSVAQHAALCTLHTIKSFKHKGLEKLYNTGTKDAACGLGYCPLYLRFGHLWLPVAFVKR